MTHGALCTPAYGTLGALGILAITTRTEALRVLSTIADSPQMVELGELTRASLSRSLHHLTPRK